MDANPHQPNRTGGSGLRDQPAAGPPARPTPACAGSTGWAETEIVHPEAYPRLRGEHRPGLGAGVGCGGLPPLARGARGQQHDDLGALGPTPACAGSTVFRFSSFVFRLAYPRLRGEHSEPAAHQVSAPGLPPLARGAPGSCSRCSAARRPTPACAGSTFRVWRRCSWRWAYPRLRGEHGGTAPLLIQCSGLPPLARGAPRTSGDGCAAVGPTPACAGSTYGEDWAVYVAEAYPRLRGEHPVRTPERAGPWGLPPLARGAREGDEQAVAGPGPTPACAGSTGTVLSLCCLGAAYPRLRGEHGQTSPAVFECPGLPPLARGALRDRVERPCPAGPTPACAGSTPMTERGSCASEAYPRLRGEHSGAVPFRDTVRGLPPLARGAPLTLRALLLPPRPTPACAGSTPSASRPRRPPQAYPRLRGEHRKGRFSVFGGVGLPPLARGALEHHARHQQHHRPTPACAGSTSRARARARGRKAYPRLRGEHRRCHHLRESASGLPPLARGALEHHARHQ